MRTGVANRMWLAVLRLTALLPIAVLAQEGCGELEAQVRQLQQENAELVQRAAGHEQAKLQALQVLEGLKGQAAALEAAKVQAEQQAVQALQAVEQLKAQVGGQEAEKMKALQAVEGLQSELASHLAAKDAALKSVEDLKTHAALQEEAAKKLEATCKAGDETPYLSTDIFAKVFDILFEATNVGFDSIKEKYPDWDAKLATVAWSVTNTTLEQVSTLSTQAAELSSSLAMQAVEVADKAKAATLDLHKTHLEPHLGQHIEEAQKQGLELYASHIEPHLGTAQKMYAEQVHPHVDTASTVVFSALATAKEQATAAYSQASELASSGMSSTLSVWATSSSHLKTLQDLELLEEKVIKVGGKVLRFPRGALDISAAVVQLALVAFIAFVIMWRLFLKVLLWRLGVKVFGTKAITLTGLVLYVFRKCVGLTVSITMYLFTTALALVSMLTSLGLLSAIGACLVYGFELSLLLGLGAGKGLTLPVRAAAGVGIGVLCGLVLGCSTLTCGICCRKKKAKKVQVNGTNGAAKAKPQAKPEAKAPVKKK